METCGPFAHTLCVDLFRESLAYANSFF